MTEIGSDVTVYDVLATVHAAIRARHADADLTVTPDDLAEMRRQYQYATAEAHMLVDGVVRLRCGVCRIQPLPRDWVMFAWCETCFTELEAAVVGGGLGALRPDAAEAG